MAKIYNINSGQHVNLTAHHSFGRNSSSNNTILENEYASRIHAVIFWDGESWKLMNKSINGTYINGIKFTDKHSSSLEKNDILHFGGMQTDPWLMKDIEPPKAMLIPVTPSLPEIILNDVAALPSEESPGITLYQSTDGSWLCASESDTRTLTSGDLVGTLDAIWRFIDASPTAITCTDGSVTVIESKDVDLYFSVSQNEEHVSLSICFKRSNMDLGERTHHYLVLMLARQRLADAKDGRIETEQGWVDKDLFCKKLGLDENHLNILIYRFRKQCINTLPSSIKMAQIIERRTGEIRVNCGNIFIK